MFQIYTEVYFKPSVHCSAPFVTLNKIWFGKLYLVWSTGLNFYEKYFFMKHKALKANV